MSDDEMESFCAQIMSGARRIGFKVKEQTSESGSFFYEFLDMDTKVRIKGASNPNKKIALTSACQTLVKYFDTKAA